MVTSSSAYTVGASEAFGIQQVIEGFNIADLAWGTANAKTVTLSFQVYSSLTGTFGGAIQNYAQNRSYPFTYTISSANTWTSVSVIIPGDTTGTWVTDNTGGLLVGFGLGCGSTYSGASGAWAGADYRSATGATSVVGTSGATWYITGVQLEVGTQATPFEFRHYSHELQMCQRYYWQMVSGTTIEVMINGYNYQSTQWESVVTYPVEMRTVPTITFTATNTYTHRLSATSPSSISYYYADSTWARSQMLIYAVFSGLTQGQGAGLCSYNGRVAGFYFNAEL